CLSWSGSASLSLRKTTKLPIWQELFLAVALSILLTRLVRGALTSRAKIIATGFSPFLQNRQYFSPALAPVTLSGWNGPGTTSPTCGPDLTALSAATTPPTTRASVRNAPATNNTL